MFKIKHEDAFLPSHIPFMVGHNHGFTAMTETTTAVQAGPAKLNMSQRV